MRRIILSEFISLDGYIAAEDGNLDWVTADEEHHFYSNNVLDSADLLLFGGTTSKIFKDYWPNVPLEAPTPPNEIATAQKLNDIAKMVFSTHFKSVDWNTTVKPKLIPEDVAKIKRQSGKNSVVFGSGQLAQSLMKYGLIDEFHLLYQPVALGKGKALFANLHQPLNLKRMKVELCESGVIRHYYLLDDPKVQRQNYSADEYPTS